MKKGVSKDSDPENHGNSGLGNLKTRTLTQKQILRFFKISTLKTESKSSGGGP